MKSPEMKSPLVEDNKKQKSSKKLTKEKNLEPKICSQESESNANESVNEYINSPEVKMQMINIYSKLQNEYGDNLYLYLKKLEKIVDSDEYKNQILNNPKIKDNNNKEEQANILINVQKKTLSFLEKRAKADYKNKRDLSKIERELEKWVIPWGEFVIREEDEKKNNENSKNNEIIKKLSEEITAMSADFTLWIWTKIKNEKQDEKQDTENILSYVKNLD